jgi:hypothetical protein
MGTFKPISQTFSELSDLIMRQQEFNANMETRQQKFALQSELQRENMKDQLMQREMNQFKLDEQRRLHTPTSFNLYEIAPNNKLNKNHVYSNQQTMDEIGSMIDKDGVGLKFSKADGRFYRPDGQEHQMTPLEMRRLMPGITGVIDRNTDTLSQQTEYLANLEKRRGNLLKAISKTDNRDSRVARGRGHFPKNGPDNLKVQLSNIEKQIEQTNALLSPAGQLSHYRTQKEKMGRRAAWAAGQGDKELQNYFQAAMGEAADAERAVMNKMLGAKGGKQEVQQRIAYKDDAPAIVINVPKGMQGVITPQMFGASEGYAFAKGETGGKGGGSGSERRLFEKGAMNELSSRYGRWDDQKQQWIITQANIDKHSYAQKILGDILNKRNTGKGEKYDMTDRNVESMSDLVNEALEQQKEFHSILPARFKQVMEQPGKKPTEKIKQVRADIKAAAKETGYTQKKVMELMGIPKNIQLELNKGK